MRRTRGQKPSVAPWPPREETRRANAQAESNGYDLGRERPRPDFVEREMTSLQSLKAAALEKARLREGRHL